MGKTIKDGASFKSAAQQLGSRGGRKLVKKYGKKHFSQMSRKRWDKNKAVEVNAEDGE